MVIAFGFPLQIISARARLLVRIIMGICVTCKNSYDKTFEVRVGDQTFEFDSFECAIQRLAPECGYCGCRIIGHGIESKEVCYCCAHCARSAGVLDACDRTDLAMIC
jgi:hypothetical protein